ncbi:MULTISPECIES: lipase family protein [unclassified Crossiella]|uniref:alpha/beta hydrolase n=1 Tax=unclassified Crossiella TaxID=2620835 RepID=UPI001FFE6F50|nr:MULTISPECIES: lipase family protein [unclassified Crossiella]MCK2237837.1 lipase family protein [Crossiella sp. S99.2]MCK2255123.1 lipase family protein [Crossiella sp. S99.1]
MKITGVKAVAAISAAVVLAGLPVAAQARESGRGTLLSATSVGGVEAAEMPGYLAKFNLSSPLATRAVDGFRIEYRTIDAQGKPTTATGLVAVPRAAERELSAVTWLHGTQVYRGDQASVRAESGDRATSYLFASSGKLAVAPDYLGLGQGAGFHPYMHHSSLVTASADAVRAARTLVRRQGIEVDRRLLVAGFSQGGSGAMALGKALQQGREPGLGVRAIAAISGPYGFSSAVADAVAGKAGNAVPYLGFMVTSWQRVHHLYDDPAKVFQRPELAPLFDGFTPNQELFPRLPAHPAEFFTPEFLARLANPDPALRAALNRESQSCAWRPLVPVKLFAATGDQDVAIRHSQGCAERTGASLTDLGAVNHNASARLAAVQTVADFARFSR